MDLFNVHMQRKVGENQEQFAVVDSDTLVTLKHSQGHQTWYELVDPKQGYKKAKLKKPRLNNVHERDNEKLLSNQKTDQLFPLNMCTSTK